MIDTTCCIRDVILELDIYSVNESQKKMSDHRLN